MIKKTEAKKQLTKFRDQLHKLLAEYPDLQIAGDLEGDVFAWMITSNSSPLPYEKVYLPKSGRQELIRK